MDFESVLEKNNVVYLSKEISSFSNLYVSVREKEGRLLNDDIVAKLPFFDEKEWALRQKTSKRFINYLSTRKSGMSFLDIGCGNGWFTNIIGNISEGNVVYGIDINREELEQAARIFKRDNIKFIYGDIFQIKDKFHNPTAFNIKLSSST